MVNASLAGTDGVVVSLHAMPSSAVATERKRETRDAEAEAGRMEPPSSDYSHTMLLTCGKVKHPRNDVVTTVLVSYTIVAGTIEGGPDVDDPAGASGAGYRELRRWRW